MNRFLPTLDCEFHALPLLIRCLINYAPSFFHPWYESTTYKYNLFPALTKIAWTLDPTSRSVKTLCSCLKSEISSTLANVIRVFLTDISPWLISRTRKKSASSASKFLRLRQCISDCFGFSASTALLFLSPSQSFFLTQPPPEAAIKRTGL
ncbi:unnamed protein product [Brassica rapa]|uniref:Uncharacterized protein n=2 Tax=Brassica TaxID=3705 RepID=A0A8D9I123_BRACM|nr:unnamed protein product [Brassica napus]CAG7909185.1 unnamed protein product [Brassica rapa]